MTNLPTSQLLFTLRYSILLIALLVPIPVLADNWQLQVGAESGDNAHQALAFLPNEIWIHSGDSVSGHFPCAKSTLSLS